MKALTCFVAILAVVTAKDINVLLYNGPAASTDDVRLQIQCFEAFK